jgi:hypothetical protein
MVKGYFTFCPWQIYHIEAKMVQYFEFVERGFPSFGLVKGMY